MASTFNLPDDILGDATTEVASSRPGAVLGGLLDEVQSGVSGATKQAFGSPGFPQPASPTVPAKQLDFETKPAGSPPTPTVLPATPATNAAASLLAAVTPAPTIKTAPASSVPVADEGEVDYDAFVRDTLLWKFKVRSAVYLVGGLLLIWALHSLLTSGISLVTGVCWLLLAQVALNFLRAFISPKLQASWTGSALTNAAVRVSTNAVKGAAVLHDKHLGGNDASKLLVITGVLWVVSLAGRLAGATGLAATLWLLAFIIPKVYTVYKSKVAKVVGDVSGQASSHFSALDPKARAALVVVPIFVAGYALSSADLAIALLALALYGRSRLAPSQVDRLSAAVAPTINNVSSTVGGAVGHLVQSAVAKYELTPTPSKAKRT